MSFVSWLSKISFFQTLILLSLPLWECGLKYGYTCSPINVIWSLPLWECGLKCLYRLTEFFYRKGHSPCGSVD